jgi:predicted HAD superfamily phosphohydrolase YqeG
MAIELKAKKNKATPEQLEWIEQLTKRGWYCIVSNDLDQVIKEIDKYLLK